MSILSESMETENTEEDATDEKAHERLLDSLFALDGKKRHNVALRRATNFSSNLDLVVHANQDTAKIQPDDLKLKRKKGSSQLKKPLSSLELEKAKRRLTREALVTDMNKWEPVVKEIRSAEQIVYTKRQHGIKMFQAVQPQAFVPRTPLEQEIFAALGKSQDILKPQQELTEAETRALKAMSIKEARARRNELLKHHELLSRMEQKAKRQKKIKSKRYRKLLKSEKVAAEKKHLEYLQKNDPNALLERLAKVHQDRMEERLTLKHRGGGKFSRLHKAYSKYDDKTREAVQEMFKKSRELTKKEESISDDDDDEEDNNNKNINTEADKLTSNVTVATSQKVLSNGGNYTKKLNDKASAWLQGSKTDSKTPNTSSNSPEDVTSVALPDETTTQPDGSGEIEVSTVSEAKVENKEKKIQSMISEPKRSFVESNDDDPSEGAEISSNVCIEPPPLKKNKLKHEKAVKSKKTVKRNSQLSGQEKTVPEKPVQEKPVPEKPVQGKSVPESVLESHDSKADNSEDTFTMEELFQDEDVIEEFTKEKAEMEGKKKLEVDSKLPGWGSWAGPDYKKAVNRQKRTPRRRQQKSQPVTAPFVWINPNRDEAMKKLLPKAVPFPFTSVRQYEASLRQPVSRGLVPETATKLLTKPEVVTKLGHIIKPLRKEDYFGKRKSLEMDLKS